MEAKRKKSVSQFFQNRKTVTFIFFLCFSSAIWLLIKLSNDYQENVVVNLRFYENDDQKIISGQSHKKVTVMVRAKGFQLLKYNLTNGIFNVDVSHLNNHVEKIDLTTSRYKSALQTQLFKKSTIVSISPEIVSITIDTLTSRKIPVKPQVQLIFTNGFQLRDSLEVVPPYVTVYGPSEIIDTTAYLVTEYHSLEDVHSNFDLPLKVSTLNRKDLVYNTKKVVVKGRVERFSEQVFDLPVRFINVPDGVSIKSFPEKISVVCKGSINDLKKITSSDFDLICDYNKIDSTSTYVTTEMRGKPNRVDIIKINDESFQVLIRKQ